MELLVYDMKGRQSMSQTKNKLSIYEQLVEVLKGQEGKLVDSADVTKPLKQKYDTNPSSVLLSDYCYNRFNYGISFQQHLFEYVTRSTYKVLGEDYPYTGFIFHKMRGKAVDEVVGEWRNGVKFLYDSTAPIQQEQMARVYEEYMRVFHYELSVLKCAPAELRHLLGRIGELHCALHTGGELARETNQHGFDVVDPQGRRISVKTTAQTKSFISFNKNTFDRFDDVYVLQYANDDFNIIYYGDKEPIRHIGRTYGSNYEVDIAKIRALGR